MEAMVEKVVRPILHGLDREDVYLWVAARIERVGWKVAGKAAGMGKAEVARARQRILRFLSADGVAKRHHECGGGRTPNL